mmetsp:Transcript_8517/g.20201  ORF Transcript_8517/g.20201 Transcript_8517/m.20201 type:complete len:231 (-) Transcript_8517:1085-1777(-)
MYKERTKKPLTKISAFPQPSASQRSMTFNSKRCQPFTFLRTGSSTDGHGLQRQNNVTADDVVNILTMCAIRASWSWEPGSQATHASPCAMTTALSSDSPPPRPAKQCQSRSCKAPESSERRSWGRRRPTSSRRSNGRPSLAVTSSCRRIPSMIMSPKVAVCPVFPCRCFDPATSRKASWKMLHRHVFTLQSDTRSSAQLCQNSKMSTTASPPSQASRILEAVINLLTSRS